MQTKLKKIILILVVINLLISCKSNPDSCLIFPKIRDLSKKEKESLKKSEVSKEWVNDIADYREIRKEVCHD